jgi:hypothetical protein
MVTSFATRFRVRMSAEADKYGCAGIRSGAAITVPVSGNERPGSEAGRGHPGLRCRGTARLNPFNGLIVPQAESLASGYADKSFRIQDRPRLLDFLTPACVGRRGR